MIRLLAYVRIPRDAHRRKITRRAVFARDRWTCQYCGHERGSLTVDHVIPRSKGGSSTWSSIVTCCAPCNRRKGDRLPKQARMVPSTAPKAPNPFTVFIHVATTTIPAAWEQYLLVADGRVDRDRPHKNPTHPSPRRRSPTPPELDTPEHESRPATAADLRGLRRWLLVAVAWAIAATAIAVIALVVANRAADEQESLRATEQIRRAQDELGAQLDRLETRLSALPTADDVSAAGRPAQEGGDRHRWPPRPAERLDGRVQDLEGRVDAVERQLDADAAGTADSAIADDTSP